MASSLTGPAGPTPVIPTTLPMLTRPETDKEIDALFEQLKRTRDLPELLEMPTEPKWVMIRSDWEIRQRHPVAHPAHIIVNKTPEWYIQKFLNKTVTARDAEGLNVALRSNELMADHPIELRWFQQFLAIQGVSVLAQTLMNISQKAPSRTEAEIALEYEVAKCLKHIFSNPSATIEALTHSSLIVTQLASSLNTPYIPTRRLLLDILCSLVYQSGGQALHLVIAALETLSSSNNEGDGPYDYWFKSLEESLSGRGSHAGASEDDAVIDYVEVNLILLIGVHVNFKDLDMQLDHRSQMEAAGLQRLASLCRDLGVPAIDAQLRALQT